MTTQTPDDFSFADTQDLINELLSRFDAAVFLASQVTTHTGDSTFAYQHVGPHPYCYGLVLMGVDKLKAEGGTKER